MTPHGFSQLTGTIADLDLVHYLLILCELFVG